MNIIKNWVNKKYLKIELVEKSAFLDANKQYDILKYSYKIFGFEFGKKIYKTKLPQEDVFCRCISSEDI